jgi:hypothetical protein
MIRTLLLIALAACRAPRLERPADAAPAPAPPPQAVAVRALAPGLSAVQVEERVLVPLEAAVGAAGVVSVAVAGAGWLRIEGDRDDTIRRLRAASPAAASLLIDVDPDGTAPRLRYTLTDPRRSLFELSQLHDAEIAEPMARLVGVLAVRACGRIERGVRVDVDPGRLAAFGLTLADVTGALDGAARDAVPELVLRAGARLRDVAVVSDSAATRCFAFSGEGRVLLGEIVTRDRAALAVVRSALAAPRGATLNLVEDAPARAVDLPAGLSDEEAARAAAELAREGAVVELDRTPAGLPRGPNQIVVYGGARPAPRLPGLATAAEAPDLVIHPDPARLSALGLSTRDVNLAVAAAREGVVAGPARVHLPGGVTPSLPVGGTTLGALATLEQRFSPAVIVRRAGARVPR